MTKGPSSSLALLQILGAGILCSSLVFNTFAADVTITDSIAAHADNTNFRTGSANIGVLPIGTKGQLIGTPEKLQSGNYGVFFTITDISAETPELKVGSQVWVYFNKDPAKSAVELSDDEHKPVVDPAKASFAKTTQLMKPFATVNRAKPAPQSEAEIKSPYIGAKPYDSGNACYTNMPIELRRVGLSDALTALIKQSETTELAKPENASAVRKKTSGKPSVIYTDTTKRVEYRNGTLSWRDHNPGNIDSAENQIGRNGHACFASDLDGLVAMRDLLKTKYANKSISNMFNIYASAHAGYAKFVQRKTKLNPKKPLKNYTDSELSVLMAAIVLKEGYTPGEVVDLGPRG